MRVVMVHAVLKWVGVSVGGGGESVCVLRGVVVGGWLVALDLCGSEHEAWAEVGDGDLVGAAFGAVFGFPLALVEGAVDDDAHAFGKGRGGVFCEVPPGVAGQESGFLVFALAGFLVVAGGCGGYAEVEDRGSLGGVSQFWVCGDVAEEGDGGFAVAHLGCFFLVGGGLEVVDEFGGGVSGFFDEGEEPGAEVCVVGGGGVGVCGDDGVFDAAGEPFDVGGVVCFPVAAEGEEAGEVAGVGEFF